MSEKNILDKNKSQEHHQEANETKSLNIDVEKQITIDPKMEEVNKSINQNEKKQIEKTKCEVCKKPEEGEKNKEVLDKLKKFEKIDKFTNIEIINNNDNIQKIEEKPEKLEKKEKDEIDIKKKVNRIEEKQAEKTLEINFGEINEKNVENLRIINIKCLPVRYSESFYIKVLGYTKYSFFAYFNDIIVGAISCREELKNNVPALYILTIGVLEPYRKYKIGTKLINEILARLKENPHIKLIYLHVQSSNEAAIAFYKKSGFEIKEKLENYYHDIEPPHAFLLEKSL